MPRNDYATAVLDIEPTTQRTPVEATPEDSFNILVLGRFSGADSRDAGAPIEIDRDNFEQVTERLAPALHLAVASRTLDLRFRGLDDFHPDAIYRRVPLFREIEASAAGPPRRVQAAGSDAGGGLLDRIVAGMPGAEISRPASAEDANDLRGFIDRVLSSSLVQGETAEQLAGRERAQAASAEFMRAILHAPEFQKLEAAWRGVHFLTRRIETGPNLRIFIAEAGSGDKIPAAPRDLRWSVIALDRAFSRSEADLQALGQLAGRAMALNAALLAEAEPPGGDAEEENRWRRFRRQPAAAHAGLALPRLSARMPYGESGESTDEFTFEEFPSAPRHSDYLWMNPAFGLAYLLAAAFARDGWRMVPGSVREIDRLPLHVYRDHGESIAKPCAEILLRETDIEQLLDSGVMPFASIRDTDRVRLVRFESAADPVRPLAGPWD